MRFEKITHALSIYGVLSLATGVSSCGVGNTPAVDTTNYASSLCGLDVSGTYLFFSSIAPTCPGKPPVVDAATEVQWSPFQPAWIFAAGTYNPATKTLNNRHHHALVYAKKNGSFYKVSAQTSNPAPASTQLSNITSAEKICTTSSGAIDIVGVIDFANPDNSQIVYGTPGANAICNDSDDTYKMVRLNMGAADTPVNAKRPIGFALHDWATGAISGWLVNDANELKRCDANFENCTASLKHIDSYAAQLLIAGSNRWLLEIDHDVYVYDDTTREAPKKIFIIIDKNNNVASHVIGGVNDSSSFYFVTNEEPNMIYKAPVDGSISASPFVADTIKPVLGLTLSANSLLYWTANGITRVNKSDGAAAAIVTGEFAGVTGDFAAITAVNGNQIYYAYSANTIPTAGIIDDDGTNKIETPAANWLGTAYDTAWNLSDGYAAVPQTLIRAEGYNAQGGFANATLHSITAATRTDTGSLGTLPTGFSSINCSSIGPNALCLGTSSTNQLDVFYLNTTVTNSLTRITTTPTQSEAVLY